MALYEYKIVSGWNGTPVNIETITPSGTSPRAVFGTTYYLPRGWPQYERGSRRFDTEGGVSFSGFKRVVWTFAVADPLAWKHAVDNWEGQVTINTTLGVPGVYTEYNAYCEVSDPAEVQNRDDMLLEFELRFKLVSTTA